MSRGVDSPEWAQLSSVALNQILSRNTAQKFTDYLSFTNFTQLLQIVYNDMMTQHLFRPSFQQETNGNYVFRSDQLPVVWKTDLLKSNSTRHCVNNFDNTFRMMTG